MLFVSHPPVLAVVEEDPLTGCGINIDRLIGMPGAAGGLLGDAEMLDEIVCLKQAMTKANIEAVRREVAALTDPPKRALYRTVRDYIAWSASTLAGRHKAIPKRADGKPNTFEGLLLTPVPAELNDVQAALLLNLTFKVRRRDQVVAARVRTQRRPYASVFDEVSELSNDEVALEYAKLQR
jgi:hypothetical protein